MVNIDTLYQRPKLGPPFRKRPINPDKIMEIVRLRDEERLRFRAIGTILGISTQGASQLYRKWKWWADTIKKAA